MMNAIIKIGLALVVAINLSVSCSIKEDRRDCPCKMLLDFSGVDTMLIKSLNVLASFQGSTVVSDTVYATEFSAVLIKDVPHGDVRVNIWAGGEDRIDQRQGVLIPYGCECPELYMDSFVADTGGESFYRKVDVLKNHCRLTVKVKGRQDVPYSLTFRGNVDGYGLDGLPSSGDFSCVAYPREDGETLSVLPRQLDSSLLMDVDDNTSVTKTFSVGEYIVASGYDWKADSLEDVVVELDYSVTGIEISIKEWDREYSYNITL